MSENALIALMAALFGGGGVKIIDYFLNRGKIKADEAAQIRKELREEAELRRSEVRRLEKELDEWKHEYYRVLEEFNTMRAEFDALKIMAERGLLNGDSSTE